MKRVLLYGLLLAAISMQAQEVLPYPTDTIDGKVYYRYTVEKSIGLYRISKNFGVSQEEILQANPDLKERGLKFEEVIRIPTNLPATPKVADVPATPDTAQLRERAQQVIQDVKERMAQLDRADSTKILDGAAAVGVVEQTDSLPAEHYTDTIRLAYILPLQAEIAQRSPTIDRFYDFYCGSLLALKHHEPTYVDSLGVQHATYYDVYTYDIGKNNFVLNQLIDSGALVNMNAMMGPAYHQQVKAVSAYAREHEIPVLVPFLPSVPDIATNPYLMKFNAYEEIQINAMMDYLDTLRSEINIVLVDAYASKGAYPAGILKLRDSIEARQLPTTHTTIRQILADSVSLSLKDSVENILLFHTERYSNVQLLMPYLLSGRQGKRLTILSQYAWLTERILLPQLFTSVFHAPQGESLARYEQDFAQYFGHQLSSTYPRYDLLGYDLTRYMLEALKDGVFRAPDSTYEGVQSAIRFTQIGNGGYENTHVTIERR